MTHATVAVDSDANVFTRSIKAATRSTSISHNTKMRRKYKLLYSNIGAGQVVNEHYYQRADKLKDD